MTSKPGKKRVTLPLRCDYTKRFAKDWERLSHSGRYNMQNLKDTIALIVANDGDLPPEYRDHELTGDWADHRECHVGGDFLLIYHLTGQKQRGVRACGDPFRTVRVTRPHRLKPRGSANVRFDTSSVSEIGRNGFGQAP